MRCDPPHLRTRGRKKDDARRTGLGAEELHGLEGLADLGQLACRGATAGLAILAGQAWEYLQ